MKRSVFALALAVVMALPVHAQTPLKTVQVPANGAVYQLLASWDPDVWIVTASDKPLRSFSQLTAADIVCDGLAHRDRILALYNVLGISDTGVNLDTTPYSGSPIPPCYITWRQSAQKLANAVHVIPVEMAAAPELGPLGIADSVDPAVFPIKDPPFNLVVKRVALTSSSKNELQSVRIDLGGNPIPDKFSTLQPQKGWVFLLIDYEVTNTGANKATYTESRIMTVAADKSQVAALTTGVAGSTVSAQRLPLYVRLDFGDGSECYIDSESTSMEIDPGQTKSCTFLTAIDPSKSVILLFYDDTSIGTIVLKDISGALAAQAPEQSTASQASGTKGTANAPAVPQLSDASLIQLLNLLDQRAYRNDTSHIAPLAELLSDSEKEYYYNKYSLSWAILPAMGNTIYGLGSWLQGDFLGGLWCSGCMIGGALLMSGTTDTNSAVFTTGIVTLLIGMISGWFIPFFFESDNNDKLSAALGYYP